MSLLVQCTKREAFHTLRTVEQLGYMVCSEHDTVSKVNDWAVLLCSLTSMGNAHCPCCSLLLSCCSEDASTALPFAFWWSHDADCSSSWRAALDPQLGRVTIMHSRSNS